jgi:hypothetical protein
LGKLKKYSASSSSVVERDALRKMVLLRWFVGAVGAGSDSGGAVGGARLGQLRLGEGRPRDAKRRNTVVEKVWITLPASAGGVEAVSKRQLKKLSGISVEGISKVYSLM